MLIPTLDKEYLNSYPGAFYTLVVVKFFFFLILRIKRVYLILVQFLIAIRRSECSYPFDLMLFLQDVKRFEGEYNSAGADINRRFKFMSPLKTIPLP